VLTLISAPGISTYIQGRRHRYGHYGHGHSSFWHAMAMMALAIALFCITCCLHKPECLYQTTFTLKFSIICLGNCFGCERSALNSLPLYSTKAPPLDPIPRCIHGWPWRSIVVRTPVLAGELSLSCARLMAGRVTTLWIRRPLSVNQHGQLSQPSLRGRLNE